MHPFLKIRTKSVVQASLQYSPKIRTQPAVRRSLNPFFKFGPNWRSVDPCIYFLKFGPNRRSVEPCISFLKFGPKRRSVDPWIFFQIRTNSTVRWSLHSLTDSTVCESLHPTLPNRRSVDLCVPFQNSDQLIGPWIPASISKKRTELTVRGFLFKKMTHNQKLRK